MEVTEPKRLRRSSSDRMISGVCGGIAKYFDIDAIIVRVLWVLFTFAGGSGIIVYIAAIIIIPLDDDYHSKTVNSSHNSSVLWGIVLIALGVMLIFGFYNFHLFGWFPHIFWQILLPIAIIVVGLVLILNASMNKPIIQSKQGTKNLYKLSEGRLFLGVAGGTGEYFNIDVSIARLIWVLLIMFSGGFGILVYLILYFVMPVKPPGVSEKVETEAQGK